jgi:hypothetical protein
VFPALAVFSIVHLLPSGPEVKAFSEDRKAPLPLIAIARSYCGDALAPDPGVRNRQIRSSCALP